MKLILDSLRIALIVGSREGSHCTQLKILRRFFYTQQSHSNKLGSTTGYKKTQQLAGFSIGCGERGILSYAL